MPQWGRPPGADVGGHGGSWREQFDSRRRRFLDLDSESDDGYRRARLDPAAFKPGALPWADQGVYASDELSFTGYDIGSGREARGNDAPYPNDRMQRSPDDGMYYDDYAAPRQSGEDALVQSAKEKLRKARVKGKTNVSLSVEEMAALERSTLGTSEPTTPSKGKNRSSRSNSSTSLSGSRPRKTSNGFFGTSSPSHSRTRTPKNGRKTSNEQRPPLQSSGSTPPAFMVRGPDGIPVYAPSDYYPSPDSTRRPSVGSNRQVTPPYEAYSPAYASRYYTNPSDLRPPSSSSGYPPYEDPAYASRSRSTSGAGYPDLFVAPPSPAAQARRVATGPSPDVAYAKLRRVPQGSPLSAMEAAADPRREWSVRGGASRQSSPSSSDDSGEGVRVEVEPQGSSGYSIKKVPVGSKSGVAVRRKGRK